MLFRSHDAVFQELTAGLNRPKAQWTPEWKTRELPPNLFAIALPHYTSLLHLNQTLNLRAITAARTGEVAKAHESALIIARINQANFNEPCLIGLLVGVTGAKYLCNTTWELCEAQSGTVEDFTRLESTILSLDLHHAALRASRSEMASAANMLQYLKGARADMLALLTINGEGTNNAGGNLLMRMTPSGFFDESGAVLVDREFRYLIKPLRDKGWMAMMQSSQEWENELVEMNKSRWMHPTYIMTSLIAPATKNIVSRCIYTQVLLDQAVIACALERHRIKHGSYPDSLDAVKLATGKPLPLDVMNGKPMGYRKTADGRYALWAVGFGGEDGGGKRTLDEKHPENTKFSDTKYVGDWVWDFPAK